MLFAKQQQEDQSLRKWFKRAREGNSEFCISNGSLNKKTTVAGHTVYQMAVPEERQGKIKGLVHKYGRSYGGHLAKEKTRERIQLPFARLEMCRDIKEWCTSCTDCKLKSRNLILDRGQSFGRNFFSSMEMDLIGPTEPALAVGHKYCVLQIHWHSY